MSDQSLNEELPGLYDDTRTLRVTGSINHEVALTLGSEPVFFMWAKDLLAAAHRAAFEADLAPEPAIDRAALLALVEKWGEHDEPSRYFYPEANAEASGIDIGYARAAEELGEFLAGGTS